MISLDPLHTILYRTLGKDQSKDKAKEGFEALITGNKRKIIISDLIRIGYFWVLHYMMSGWEKETIVSL